MKFTSVVSLHTNEYGCGVAKFSKELAKRLGVPFLGFSRQARHGGVPLFSLKASEMDEWDIEEVMEIVESVSPYYGVFWHDAGVSTITADAKWVFYADPSLGSPGLWCPSLITPRKRPVRLFSFGMAHKLQTDKYKRVRELLDAAGQPYHLRVSVGLHEGTSLDGAEKHFDSLREIMGPENVTILGILSDDAVSEELHNADYVLAFFEKGLRANNTTVNTALDHGCRVITNRDTQSPTTFFQDVLCVCCIDEWPKPEGTPFSWDNLLKQMEEIYAATTDRQSQNIGR